MPKNSSTAGMLAGAVVGTVGRFGLTFSEIYQPGWNWWFQHSLRASPGTAGFAGYVDTGILVSNYTNVGYCLVVALLPGLIGGAIGALSGATGRPIVGAMFGGFLSGLVLLLMRLPEIYRPGWFGRLWLDYNLPILVEGASVGATVGALAGGIGLLTNRLRARRGQQLNKPNGRAASSL